MADSGSEFPPSFSPSDRGPTRRSPHRGVPSQNGAAWNGTGQQGTAPYPPSFSPTERPARGASSAAPSTASSARHAAPSYQAPSSYDTPLPISIAPTPGISRQRPARASSAKPSSYAASRSASSQNRGAVDSAPRSYAPASYAPATSRRTYGASADGVPSYPAAGRQPAPSSPATPTPGTPSSPANPANPAIPGDPDDARTRAKTHHPLRIIAAVVIALLAAVLIFGWTQIQWINNSLNHETMLSGSSNTAGMTWLVLGSDERDGTVGGTSDEVPGFRTDTILVLTKPSSGAASLISIPRDSYVTVDGTDMKINAVAESYGYPQLVKTVEGITGVTIDHVVRIGFSGVTSLVDAVGGVELCLDYDVDDAYSGLVWQAGCHTADGTTALAFARMRYSDPQGDIGRAERQRQVISAIMTKVTQGGAIHDYASLHAVGDAAMSVLTVDENTNAFTMARLALAFRDATGSGGVTGTAYYSDPGYYPASGIGSCVLLDDDKNHELFNSLSHGSIPAGTVGGYTGA